MKRLLLASILLVGLFCIPTLAVVTESVYEPTYTGSSTYNHSIFTGNGSGTWTTPEGVTSIDVWLCGGAGSGSAGGGGSGYCQMYNGIETTPFTPWDVFVGYGAGRKLSYAIAGGRGNTSFVSNGTLGNMTADGGYGGQILLPGQYGGGNGGEGGGGFGSYAPSTSAGGTAGGNGDAGHVGNGGTGSGNATCQREFCVADAQLRGGGGAGGYGDTIALGGAPGGGIATNDIYGGSGLQNFAGGGAGAWGTGGGYPGAGADGVIIIRYLMTGTLVADFTAVPTTIFQNGCVQFTDASSGSPNGWYWEFGDGNVSWEQNPLHCYNVLGNHTVSLNASKAVIA